MTKTVLCLDQLPREADFYEKYWNKKPFIVKNALCGKIIDGLISADQLAGLALEDDIRSRIVTKGNGKESWSCDHGPFSEDMFGDLGEENWSLLVQDVEKNHPPVAEIISSFAFSPGWLIDDVMVSYSTPGGGVGPHIDSYHVFLIQGKGTRRWKIGNEAIKNEKYVENIDLKILKDPFMGDEFEVTIGDVIYIPPYFPHSGDTLSEAMTFSIGFLGPSLSELMVEYGQYIEQNEHLNDRYAGELLDGSSAGSEMADSEVDNFRNRLINAINSAHFEKWLKEYFNNDD